MASDQAGPADRGGETQSRPLRLLVLDGGGVRGLSSLYIIERLMHVFNSSDSCDETRKPCEVFDIIAGTSTGGLIAILLGRLGLTVDQAIVAYKDMAPKIFTRRKRSRVLPSKVLNLVGQSTFNTHVLESTVKELLRSHGFAEDEPLLDRSNPSTQSCNVFVCTTMSNSAPLRLRSYVSSAESPVQCSIVAAARATSAAPTFFDPVILSCGTTLRDGAMLNNNPIYEMMLEVQANQGFSPRGVHCIVSIGTGRSGEKEWSSHLLGVAAACAKITTDTEAAHLRFKKMECGLGGRYFEKYFRFNVDGGRDIRLDEWKAMDSMRAAAHAYLHKVSDEVQKCATVLRDFGAAEPTAPTSPPLVPSPPPPPTAHDSIVPVPLIEYTDPMQDGLDWAGQVPIKSFRHRPEMDELDRILGSSAPGNRNSCALVGIGGAGKSQLATKYARNQFRTRYTAIFWVDATSHSTIMSGFLLIANALGITPLVSGDESSRASNSQTLVRQHQTDYIVGFKQWISKRQGKWLLVFDNADDESVIKDMKQYFPSGGQGDIIITSRRRGKVCPGNFVDHVVDVGGLETSTAVEILLERGDINSPDEEDMRLVQEIAQEVDNLALALDLAGGFLRQYKDALKDFLGLYRTSRAKVLREILGDDELSLEYPTSIVTTWNLSMDRIQARVGLAGRNLLVLFSYMDTTNLNFGVFERASQTRRRWNTKGMIEEISPYQAGVPMWFLNAFSPGGRWDSPEFRKVINEICSYSFGEIHTAPTDQVLYRCTLDNSVYKVQPGLVSRSSVTLHPLLHEVARLCIRDEDFLAKFKMEATSIACHAVDDDVPQFRESRPSRIVDEGVHVFQSGIHLAGGISFDAAVFMMRLEEASRHLQRSAPEMGLTLWSPISGYYFLSSWRVKRIQSPMITSAEWKIYILGDIHWFGLLHGGRRAFFEGAFEYPLKLAWLTVAAKHLKHNTNASVWKMAANDEAYLEMANQKRQSLALSVEGDANGGVTKLSRPRRTDWDRYKDTDIRHFVEQGFSSLNYDFETSE